MKQLAEDPTGMQGTHLQVVLVAPLQGHHLLVGPLLKCGFEASPGQRRQSEQPIA
jgi:hypothetical protein